MGGDYLDEVHERIAAFAEEFLDDEEEREAFVDGLLERRGYRRVSSWAPPEPEPAQGGGGQRRPLLKQPQRQRGDGQRPATGQPGGGKRAPYFR